MIARVFIVVLFLWTSCCAAVNMTDPLEYSHLSKTLTDTSLYSTQPASSKTTKKLGLFGRDGNLTALTKQWLDEENARFSVDGGRFHHLQMMCLSDHLCSIHLSYDFVVAVAIVLGDEQVLEKALARGKYAQHWLDDSEVLLPSFNDEATPYATHSLTLPLVPTSTPPTLSQLSKVTFRDLIKMCWEGKDQKKAFRMESIFLKLPST